MKKYLATAGVASTKTAIASREERLMMLTEIIRAEAKEIRASDKINASKELDRMETIVNNEKDEPEDIGNLEDALSRRIQEFVNKKDAKG